MYNYLEPEVAGELGEKTKLDFNVHPPIVHFLEYRFDGWLGDCILETFPCFIIVGDAKKSIEKECLSGIFFEDVFITKSEFFEEMYPRRELPKFYWAKITGRAGVNDIGLSNDFRLVVSQKGLDVLKSHNIDNALISNYESE